MLFLLLESNFWPCFPTQIVYCIVYSLGKHFVLIFLSTKTNLIYANLKSERKKSIRQKSKSVMLHKFFFLSNTTVEAEIGTLMSYQYAYLALKRRFCLLIIITIIYS